MSSPSVGRGAGVHAKDVVRALTERWQVMSVDQKVALHLDDLSVDVFELADQQGVVVESLTAGHGTIKMGASVGDCSCCCCSLVCL